MNENMIQIRPVTMDDRDKWIRLAKQIEHLFGGMADNVFFHQAMERAISEWNGHLRGKNRRGESHDCLSLSQMFHTNRTACTNAKTDFIVRVTKVAKKYYGKERADG